MEVVALVGPSGTGKSHRANLVAHNIGADIIIDDGLVIQDNQIISGVSSKSQPTRIGAIKIALFMDEEQTKNSKEAISEINPQKILILGTSKGMVEKVARRLELQPISKYINIEEVASLKEIRKARSIRNQYYKHVIPATTVEVKKSLPEILVDPLQVFLRKKGKNKHKNEAKSWLEQSVVRPTFTYYGNLTISQNALMSIAKITAENIEGVSSVKNMNLHRDESGIILEMNLIVLLGTKIDEVSKKIQKATKDQMEYMTGLFVKSININVSGINFSEKK